MEEDGAGIESHVGEWWFSFGVALFLLVPFDLFTTLVAVGQHGMVVEANPIMRWLLRQGLFAVVTVHIVVAGIAAVMFHVALDRIRDAPRPYHRPLTRVVNVWVGVLLVGGALLVANNLLVIV